MKDSATQLKEALLNFDIDGIGPLAKTALQS